jgi:uncharacterized protein YecT (DUF1311 family)
MTVKSQKMNLLRTAIFIGMVITMCPAIAQTTRQDKIDENYFNCLQKDTSYVNICNCAFEAFGKWDKEMDRTYNKLLRTLKKDKDKAAIKHSQKAWLAFKDAEFNTYNNIYNLPGNNWSLLRQNGRIDLLRARTLQLREYLEALKVP